VKNFREFRRNAPIRLDARGEKLLQCRAQGGDDAAVRSFFRHGNLRLSLDGRPGKEPRSAESGARFVGAKEMATKKKTKSTKKTRSPKKTARKTTKKTKRSPKKKSTR
jgi:hypothetical protein